MRVAITMPPATSPARPSLMKMHRPPFFSRSPLRCRCSGLSRGPRLRGDVSGVAGQQRLVTVDASDMVMYITRYAGPEAITSQRAFKTLQAEDCAAAIRRAPIESPDNSGGSGHDTG